MDKPSSLGGVTIHSLGLSQSDLGDDCAAACSMTAAMFCHCLLACETRDVSTMVRVLSKWLYIGCWVYRTRASHLRENTSSNPTFNGNSLYLNPARLAQLVPEIGTSMRIADELVGVLYSRASSFDSIDAEYEAEDAFISLEEVVRRMAMLAADTGPVAATLTTNGSTHAIGVSLRVGMTRKDLSDPVEASSPTEAVQLLDLIWDGCLNIDFVDSHKNFVTTERRGKGIWMTFPRLADLCAYIRERHPMVPPKTSVAPNIYAKRPNSFEVCLWQEVQGMALEDTPLLDLAVRLETNEGFRSWIGRTAKKRKAIEAGSDERLAQTSSVRQRIEKSIQKLCCQKQDG